MRGFSPAAVQAAMSVSITHEPGSARLNPEAAEQTLLPCCSPWAPTRSRQAHQSHEWIRCLCQRLLLPLQPSLTAHSHSGTGAGVPRDRPRAQAGGRIPPTAGGSHPQLGRAPCCPFPRHAPLRPRSHLFSWAEWSLL